MTAGYKWTSLMPASVTGVPYDQRVIDIAMAQYQCDREEALRRLEEYDAQCSYFRNDLYQVQVRPLPEIGMVHLNIRRVDGAPIHDWRHLQQIKNELVGPECEAIELYPAESRLTDTTNKYHLWANVDPTFRFPIGFNQRDVSYESGPTGGLRQREPLQHRKRHTP